MSARGERGGCRLRSPENFVIATEQRVVKRQFRRWTICGVRAHTPRVRARSPSGSRRAPKLVRFAEPFARFGHTGINMIGKDVERETQDPRWGARVTWHRASGAALAVVLAIACGSQPQVSQGTGGLTTGAGAVGGTGGTGGTGGSAAEAAMGGTGADPGTGGTGAQGGTTMIDPNQGQMMEEMCPATTCAELGYGCGAIVDACGKVINCADEGLTCGPLEACVGGVDTPTKCMVGGGEPCELCGAVPDCSTASQPTTITGRVVTPGRNDANVENQLGVPNAFVYILRNKGVADLPAIKSGIPEGGTSCDRCEDQDLGPVLVGTVTDATGAFKLEGNVPVGDEFTMVVKAGRFRRAFNYTLPDAAACQTTVLPTALPENPARLPRSMTDGLAVNIPHIAVSTGEVDAMECVLEKMGIAHEEFVNPGADGSAAGRVHLYVSNITTRAGEQEFRGARLDDMTPAGSELYGSGTRLTSYDIVLADCEGGSYDQMGTERTSMGANVIDYVNRGGRFFASHLSFTWLDRNGMAAYSADAPNATGLAAAATWSNSADNASKSATGNIALGRPLASPRIQSFADWMASEHVTTPPDQTFKIIEPRSQATMLGASSEEFVFNSDVTKSSMGMDVVTPEDRTQQFSFNTPYAAPDEAVCGRVAYSGFHVSVSGSGGMTSPFVGAVFPDHCTAGGNLTNQEKVLLYMLFDLATCVGDTPPPPECTPTTCDELGVRCGFSGDGCGKVLDCGACPIPITR